MASAEQERETSLRRQEHINAIVAVLNGYIDVKEVSAETQFSTEVQAVLDKISEIETLVEEYQATTTADDPDKEAKISAIEAKYEELKKDAFYSAITTYFSSEPTNLGFQNLLLHKKAASGFVELIKKPVNVFVAKLQAARDTLAPAKTDNRNTEKRTSPSEDEIQKFGDYAEVLYLDPRDLINKVVCGSYDRNDRAAMRDNAYNERIKRMKAEAKEDTPEGRNIRLMVPIVENVYIMYLYGIMVKGDTINIDNLTVNWETLSGILEKSSDGLSFYDTMRTSEFYIRAVDVLTEKIMNEMLFGTKWKANGAWNVGKDCVSYCHSQLMSSDPEYRQFFRDFGKDGKSKAEALVKEVAAYDASFRDLRTKAAIHHLGVGKSAFKHTLGEPAEPSGILHNAGYQTKNLDLGQYATLWGMGVNPLSDPLRAIATGGWYERNGRKLIPGEPIQKGDILFVPFEGSKKLEDEIEELKLELQEVAKIEGKTSASYKNLSKKLAKLSLKYKGIADKEKEYTARKKRFGVAFDIIDQNLSKEAREAKEREFQQRYHRECAKGLSEHEKTSEVNSALFDRIVEFYPESVRIYLEYLFGSQSKFVDQRISLSDLFLLPPVDDFMRAPLFNSELSSVVTNLLEKQKKIREKRSQLPDDLKSGKINEEEKEALEKQYAAELEILEKDAADAVLRITSAEEIELKRKIDNNMANYKRGSGALVWLKDTATTTMAKELKIPHDDEAKAEQMFRDLAKNFGTQLAIGLSYAWEQPYYAEQEILQLSIIIRLISEKLRSRGVSKEKKKILRERLITFKAAQAEAERYRGKAEAKKTDMSIMFKKLTEMYLISILAQLPWDKNIKARNKVLSMIDKRVHMYYEIVETMQHTMEEYVESNSSLKMLGLKFGFLRTLSDEVLKTYMRKPHLFEENANINYWAAYEQLRGENDPSNKRGTVSSYIRQQLVAYNRADDQPKYPFRKESETSAKK